MGVAPQGWVRETAALEPDGDSLLRPLLVRRRSSPAVRRRLFLLLLLRAGPLLRSRDQTGPGRLPQDHRGVLDLRKLLGFPQRQYVCRGAIAPRRDPGSRSAATRAAQPPDASGGGRGAPADPVLEETRLFLAGGLSSQLWGQVVRRRDAAKDVLLPGEPGPSAPAFLLHPHLPLAPPTSRAQLYMSRGWGGSGRVT